MSLKCPICGKEYFHDRKICPICESKSKPTRSTIKEENLTQKWNCGIFLGIDTLAFGKCKPSDSYIKITSEPKFSNFITKEGRAWNCDSIVRLTDLNNSKSEIYSLEKDRNLQIRNSNIFPKGANTSLIYE